jgi:hypothetical protein
VVLLEQDRPQQASKGPIFLPDFFLAPPCRVRSLRLVGILRGGTTLFPLVSIVDWRGGAGGSMTRPRKYGFATTDRAAAVPS